MNRVLVVDDEPQILRALLINLRARGYDVRTAGTGRAALREAAAYHPDIVVLDLGLPDLDGVDVIHGLRGWTAVPIIVLSGRADSRDKVEALDAGADDYVTKPFAVDELLARLRAVARRAPGEEAPPTAVVGDWLVDLAAHTVTRTPESAAAEPDLPTEARLTPTEWQLLEALLKHPGKLVGQKQLLADVWGPATDDAHYLREYMARLRRKLEREPARPRHLLTEPGMGSRFRP